MDAAELELFEQSMRQATERHTGEALDAAVADLGWPDALAEDPHAAVSTLFPWQGVANTTSSALDQVVATGLGLDPATADAVLLPRLGTVAAPAHATGDGTSIRGLGTAALRRADRAVIVATSESDGTCTVGTVAQSDLQLQPVGGMDPDFGLVEVTGDRVDVRALTDAPGSTWHSAVVLAQLAVSYEILGAARTMLALARDHALDRIQYGRPISSFQAVRHRLADALVAIEAAEAAVDATRDVPTPQLAVIAKSLAGRGALDVARHSQQVLAGIGFTADHPFHRYFRRVLLLDQLFGSAHSLTSELGAELLRSRQLPQLLPLA